MTSPLGTPICTAEEMRAIDAEATTPLEVLVGRAGRAVANRAVELMGGTYGRHVVVVAGPGNNGADGRIAGHLLEARGVRVRIVDHNELPVAITNADLVIDACYGTGFRGSFAGFEPGAIPVLAVDLPSGLDAATGELQGRVVPATATVTFAALKPGLLIGAGPENCGEVTCVDIGLDVSRARMWHGTDASVTALWPRRPRNAHKWNSAVLCIGGAEGYEGALSLCVRGAQCAGASMVSAATPGRRPRVDSPDCTTTQIPMVGWGATAAGLHKYQAIVIGPGLGREPRYAEEIAKCAEEAHRLVIDADALWAVGNRPTFRFNCPTVLTPHAGEFAALTGHPVGGDSIASAKSAARDLNAVLLLKGPTTVITDGDRVGLVTSGSPRLATAGTGDVLAGMIGALLAANVDPFEAATMAAHAHGRGSGWAVGATPSASAIANGVNEWLGDALD